MASWRHRPYLINASCIESRLHSLSLKTDKIEKDIASKKDCSFVKVDKRKIDDEYDNHDMHTDVQQYHVDYILS